MLEYIKKRAKEERVMPAQNEIKILEVFKKLVESGWIVRQPEVMKMFNLAGITSGIVRTQKGLDRFLKKFIAAAGMNNDEFSEFLV